MGFKDMNSGDSDFVKFREGDNAIVQLSQLDVDTGNYQGDEYQQLYMRFDAVNETDESQKGVVPGWFSSKITVRDSDEHTSSLAKLLEEAGVLRTVLSEVVEDLGAESDFVDRVIEGDTRFIAEDHDENVALAKAVASALKGKNLRVGTSLNSSEDYSVVKSVHGLSEGSSDSDDEDDKEVVFPEDDSE